MLLKLLKFEKKNEGKFKKNKVEFFFIKEKNVAFMFQNIKM